MRATCRVDLTVGEHSAIHREGSFSIRQDQLRVTTPSTFWKVVEMTAERGVLSAPAVEDMSEEQIYGMTWPPSKHDDYLPEPTSLNTVPTESTLG